MTEEKIAETGPAEASPPPEGEAPPEGPASFGAKLFGSAKKAKEQAQAKATDLASKAGDLTSQAATRAGQLKDQAATKAGEVKDSVAAKAVEMKDAGFEKLAETLDDFNSALPVIREAGYTLSGVDIQIGIPPKISAGFSASDDVSAEKVEQLLVQHADKKLTVLLMKSLYQAWRLQMKIAIVGLKPKGLSVEIGLIPTVSVKFA